MSVRVIVSDGDTRTALAAVRSLGRAGYEVGVVAASSPSMAGASRYAVRQAVLCRPHDDPAAFRRGLAAFAQAWGAHLVLPVTDGATDVLLQDDDTHLGSATVIGPPRRAYDALSDKAQLLERAQSLGIVIPRTVVAHSLPELQPAAHEIGYPCVIKPHRSVVSDGSTLLQVSVRYAENDAALARLASQFVPGAYPLLVQERIVGHGEGAFFLMHEGRTLAAFAHRRIREYPVTGGASTYRESAAVPADLRSAGERLLRSAGWRGAAMVEFRRCSRTGTAYLMEVNARLWGSLQLAIDAGVDFPAMMVRLALGEMPAAVETYRVGVRSRWLWGDVDHLIDRLRSSPQELGLPADTPSRLRLLLAFAAFVPGRDRFEVLDLADPRPFVVETRRWLGGRLGAALGRWRRR
jgi:predicted ATP-grasp superfamily ATP-dependent carboligase